jgi:iron complex outermembrane receptor protein
VCNTGDIHINGLEGPYTMVLIDGMPIVSSLSTVYGLAGIPNSLVKRIEVVKGPASTLYGSEAVGGVINIITKSAKDTQGGLASLGAGTADRGFGSFRWGGTVGESTYYRASAQGVGRSALERNDNGATPPTGLAGSFGMRLDSQEASDTWHLSAGYTGGSHGETPIRYGLTAPFKTPFTSRMVGYTTHVLGRWSRTLSPTSDIQVQGYVGREEAQLHTIDSVAQTFDLELQHRFKVGERNQVVVGGGYRLRQTSLTGSHDVAFSPEERNTGVFSAFGLLAAPIEQHGARSVLCSV